MLVAHPQYTRTASQCSMHHCRSRLWQTVLKSGSSQAERSGREYAGIQMFHPPLLPELRSKASTSGKYSTVSSVHPMRQEHPQDLSGTSAPPAGQRRGRDHLVPCRGAHPWCTALHTCSGHVGHWLHFWGAHHPQAPLPGGGEEAAAHCVPSTPNGQVSPRCFWTLGRRLLMIWMDAALPNWSAVLGRPHAVRRTNCRSLPNCKGILKLVIAAVRLWLEDGCYLETST